MWNNFYDAAKQVFTFGKRDSKDQRDIETIRQEDVKQVMASLQRMAYEIQRLRDELHYGQREERHEREKAALRLENEMLKFERRLPSSKPDTSTDE